MYVCIYIHTLCEYFVIYFLSIKSNNFYMNNLFIFLTITRIIQSFKSNILSIEILEIYVLKRLLIILNCT